ncbi:MAG: TatD family hydrolase [Desulfamplus sp.]|nr:TatD family hydrolase [Desulfamplus sp.]
MRLFDSHAHIDDDLYDSDFNDMLIRAYDFGVEAIMVAGVTPETISKALMIAQQQQVDSANRQNKNGINIFISVGMHPHDAKQCSDDIISNYKELADKYPSIIKAWGETGLDFNRMHSPCDVQEKWFIRQIEAADDLNLALIFHERDSNGKFLEILKSLDHKDRRGVVHCFSGTRQEMFSYLDLGYYIGITGILTLQQRGDMLRELALLIPEDRIVIETDAPYLTPAPMKNKTRRNEPAFVKYVFNRLAEIKSVDPEQLADRLWQNSCLLYNITELQ